METTKEQKLAQSIEDKAAVGIKKCRNGFTLRIEGETWVFSKLEDVFEHIRKMWTEK